ncbi:Hint domain-containing protein [Methylobacterium komagatae]|uniref:Hint domain-containing protein n=1 Tax=Methylobacterium komagatae TaxID=374425 RepID=A0ABW2BLW5_9HYPH
MVGPMAMSRSLVAGEDTVIPNPDDLVVNATSLTLNASDSLDAGAGYDVLSLSGSGSFNLAGLAQFAGFEEVRLTNASASSASLVLRDGADLKVTLSDGSAPSTSPYPTYSSAGSISVTLAKSLVTITGGNETDQFSAATAAQLVAGSSIDGGGGYDGLSLSYDYTGTYGTSQIDPATGLLTYVPPTYRDTVYDLTKISLSHVENLNAYGNFSFSNNTTTIVKVDTASLKDVSYISLYDNAVLTTEAATLNLSGKSIYGSSGGGAITSSNALGTTFTVNSATTATQIQGGAGQDTVVVTGLTLTEAQRAQIFAGSVETVTDASGTYTKPSVPTGVIALTTGTDLVAPTDTDQVVQATSTTLNSTDRLDAGAGYDVLSLSGSGSFNLAGLAQFAGFEEVRLTNASASSASLVLRDGADLKVTLSDGSAPSTSPYPTYSSAGSISVTLAKSLVTITGGNETDQFSAATAAQLVAGSSIDGGGGYDGLSLSYDYTGTYGTSQIDPATGLLTYVPPTYRDTVYDLTKISLSHVENLNAYGNFSFSNNTTTIVKVDTASLKDVSYISLYDNAVLTTEAATLNLSGKSIYGSSGGGAITSSNALGTTFTVNSATTATQIQGGAGQDTVVVTGLTLTEAQRAQIFAGSVETVTDASGTYTKPSIPTGVAVDGYISGGTVFADANSNGRWDPGEARTTTDAQGRFTLQGGSGPLVLTGGTDTSTGVALTHTLTAPSGSSVITPLTTLVQGVQQRLNVSTSEAESAVLKSLGVTLAAGQSLLTTDPVAGALAGDSGAQALYVAGVKILDTIALVGSALSAQSGDPAASDAAVVSAMAAQIASSAGSSGGASLDIAGTQALSRLVTKAAGLANLSMAPEAADALASLVSASNTAVDTQAQAANDGATLLHNTAAVQFVAQSLTALALSSGQSPSSLQLSFTGDGLSQAITSAYASVPCYCTGTLILTDRGELPVEQLVVGDVVITMAGEHQTIEWIGHRTIDCRLFARPDLVSPIRIKQGALAPSLPRRDLFLSPDHALFFDEVLIPAKSLVNGSTVEQIAAETITYYSIELANHDLVLAEGVAAETYYDDGQRDRFDNYDGNGSDLDPNKALTREGSVRPLIIEGRQVAEVRAWIDARAHYLGHPPIYDVKQRAPQHLHDGMIADSSVVSTKIDGYLERVSREQISGWAWFPEQPHASVVLELVLDGDVVATFPADQYRVDLHFAGIGTGRHAFNFRMPPAAYAREWTHIGVRARDSSIHLTHSPVVLAEEYLKELILV